METPRETKEFPKGGKRKKKIVNLAVAAALVIALAVGGVLLYRMLTKKEDSVSRETWRVSAVSEGEISAVISGSGTLAAVKTQSVTAGGKGTVETVLHQSGDALSAGDVVMTLSSSTVKTELDALKSDLADLREELADTDQYRTSLTVTAGKRGVVKDLRAVQGTLCEELDYLCLISTDGKMKLTIPAGEGMQLYDAVTADIAGAAETGRITALTADTATVVVDGNEYDMGALAQIYSEDGALLGEGTLEVNEYVEVSVSAGCIADVYVTENQSVSGSKTLFKLKKGAPTEEYTTLKEEEAELLEEIEELENGLTVKADFDCILTTLSVSEGDEVAAGDALCEMDASEGYRMTLSIDELDIASVKHGQDVTVTLDAIDGTYRGTVENISYAGSGSYVTSYTATVLTDPIEGAYPGMSASAEIITQTSGTSAVVSVSAVQYDGEQAYLYLAPEGAAAGDSTPREEMDFDSLTKVNVTTGMSDGSNIVVSGEGIQAGDLIYVPNLTTAATYTADEETTTTFSGMGGMGNMNGGMPGGNFGGNMGGNMPSGNFGGGNMGGGQRPNG